MSALLPLRVIGNYTTPPRSDGGSFGSDITALLEDILLFDHVVIDSARLLEFCELVRVFDADAVTDLIKSGAVTIHIDALTTGTNGTHHLPPLRGELPPDTFALSILGLPDEDHHGYVSESIADFAQNTSLAGKRLIKLKGAIAEHLIRLPRAEYREFLIAETYHDLHNRPDLLAEAVAIQLRKVHIPDIESADLRIRLTPRDHGVIGVEHNLEPIGIRGSAAIDVVRRAAHAVALRTQRVADMKFHRAVPGFRPDDLPLLERKLDFLAKSVLPDGQRENLRRVICVAGLPSLAQVIDARQLRLDRLIEVRGSVPCLEFRRWLASSDAVPDAVVREMASSIKAKLHATLTSPTARAISILATKALGIIPVVGPVLGPAMSAGEKYLIDRVLKTPGPVTFLGPKYRSLYE